MTIPAKRRVSAAAWRGNSPVVNPETDWRFARGVPPHTFAEETVIDLVHAATDLDDVIAYVTGAFARDLTSEERLRREAAARKKLRWRADLDEIIPSAAGGAHSVLEYRYDRDVEQAHGLPPASKQARFTKPDGSRGRRDRYYEEYGLIIELDGRQYHPDERRGLDQARDNDATATGGSTLRYGWDRCHPQAVRRGGPSPRRAYQARLHRPAQALLAHLRRAQTSGVIAMIRKPGDPGG